MMCAAAPKWVGRRRREADEADAQGRFGGGRGRTASLRHDDELVGRPIMIARPLDPASTGEAAAPVPDR